MNKYQKLFEAGNKAQLEQMEMNKHKDGWDDFPVSLAAHSILSNLKEIIDRYDDSTMSGIEVVRRRAANISNFANMIILRCDNVINEGRDSE